MEPMKQGLAKPAIQRISHTFAQVCDFNQSQFERLALLGLEELELKARVLHVIRALNQSLPSDFVEAAAILANIPNIWEQEKSQYEHLIHPNFAAWPIIDYVAVYGLDEPDISLDLLKRLTVMFSAEFAIRPFIQRYPELCLQYFNNWVTDENEHVRRLVSEGTRPLLPWGIRLTQFVLDPTPNLILLNALKQDPSLYVRRSVANHLNDIAKNDVELVIDVCSNWYKEADENTLWLIKHACRGLIKAGHPSVFKLLGYTDQAQITISEIALSADQINLGEIITFAFDLRSTGKAEQHIVVDYKIYFMRANGKQSEKVFKLKNIKLAPLQTVNLAKSHSFKAITTRKYYPGKHKIEIMVNGIAVKHIEFNLV